MQSSAQFVVGRGLRKLQMSGHLSSAIVGRPSRLSGRDWVQGPEEGKT